MEKRHKRASGSAGKVPYLDLGGVYKGVFTLMISALFCVCYTSVKKFT